MLHILLFILKIIGILLLFILGLILLVLALVLLAPIRYRAAVQKTAVTDGDDGKQINNLTVALDDEGFIDGLADKQPEDSGVLGKQTSVGDTLENFASSIRADGKVSWLLGLISLTCGYNGRQAHMDIRLFGRSLLHKKPKKKRRQQERRAADQTEKVEVADRAEQEKAEASEGVRSEKIGLPENDTILDDNSVKRDDSNVSDKVTRNARKESKLAVQMLEADGDASNTLMIKDEKDTQEDEHDTQERRFSGIYQRIRSVITGITSIPSKIWQKICSICDAIRHLLEQKERLEAVLDRYLDFWHRTCTQAAKEHILKEVKYLLRHILPKKLEGTLTFGFEDPATTGQVLGILCILTVFTGNQLEVNGNFEGLVLEGDVALKGHIRLCHIAKTAVSLLTDKNIRKTIRDGRKLVGG